MTEKEAWIAFSAFVPFGPARFSLLLKYFGSAQKAWEASIGEYATLGLSKNIVQKYSEFRERYSLMQYLEQLNKLSIETVTSEESEYPKRLKDIDSSPYLLYVRKGKECTKSLNDFAKFSISVIGTRKMTAYGRDVAERLVTRLSDSGVTIISGLALGIDAVAHSTAIESGGFTIGVVGSGIDKIYPASNYHLAQKMLDTGRGIIISEYPLGYPARPENFPQRNRIVSGMSCGVLVIEGTEKSGTLLTAKSAAEQGREVYAVPGPIYNETSRAPHYLIKNGAKLVESAEDILDDLDITSTINKVKTSKNINLGKDEEILLSLIPDDGIDIDSLVRISSVQTSSLLGSLTILELKGMVKNVGGIYVKISN